MHDNLKMKGLSKREATDVYLRSLRIAIREALIRAEAQTVFPRGDEGRGCL